MGNVRDNWSRLKFYKWIFKGKKRKRKEFLRVWEC